MVINVLFESTNKVPVVMELVDKLYAPIFSVIHNIKVITDILYFKRKFAFNFLKTSTQDALITACVIVASVLTVDASCIESYSFAGKHRFAPYYGFSESEVISVLQKLNMSHKMEEIRKWYDGYLIEGSDTTVYNVWSFVNYLSFDAKVGRYWVNSGDMPYFNDMCYCTNIRPKLLSVLNDEKVVIKLVQNVTINELHKLKKMLHGTCLPGEENADLYLQLLTESGYLNIVDRQGDDYVSLRIPNLEIRHYIKINFYDREPEESKQRRIF